MLDDPNSNLHQLFEISLLNGRGFPHQSSGKFRPGEASATIQTKHGPIITGTCARKVWYRLKGIKPSDEGLLAHQVQRMNVGKAVEVAIIEKCKQEGLYVDNNIPFQTVMDGIPIAGEMDAVLRTSPCGGEKYCLEVKSFYGYPAQKELLGRFINVGQEVGKPKDSYVMQIALYLNEFSRLPEDNPAYLPFGAIFVCDRGDGHFGVYDVWLEKEIKFINEDEMFECHRIFYKSDRMGIKRTVLPYSVEDILSRYRMVQNLLYGDTPPERDFQREWDESTVEQRYSLGMVSDSAYKAWKGSHGPRGKGKQKLGDWNCSYCQYETLCWKNKKG